MKKVLIFGSTGSIGRSALDVIRRHKEDFEVIGLCAYKDTPSLHKQIKEFSPSYVCVCDETAAKDFEKVLSGKKIKFFKGDKGLQDFAALKSDISVMGISGVACLKPLMINIKYCKRIALASKEPIVVAGQFVFDAAKKNHSQIVPVDSEINALFQLMGDITADLGRVYLTASGGALFDHSREDIKKVTVGEVLNHPTWRMGRRITVDSATLVNKGFEVVETHFFFKVPYENIGVVVHRESLVHALVECKDNALFACIYPTDMRIPIAYAMHYPVRKQYLSGIDFAKKFSLSFQPLDYDKFPLLKIVREAAVKGGNSLAVINACDEVVVESFLNKEIKFTDIHKVMEHIWYKCPYSKTKNVDDIFYWDNWARAKTLEYIKKVTKD